MVSTFQIAPIRTIHTHVYTTAHSRASFAGKHVVTVEQFARDDMHDIFALASELAPSHLAGAISPFAIYAPEKSWRLSSTKPAPAPICPFKRRCSRLGGDVIATSGGVQFSSVYKGENLADTVRAAACYADVIVLRHPEVGSSYEAAYYLDRLSERLGRKSVLISGGDGIGEHPTQALLDLFTIFDSKHHINRLTSRSSAICATGAPSTRSPNWSRSTASPGRACASSRRSRFGFPPAIIEFLARARHRFAGN